MLAPTRLRFLVGLALGFLLAAALAAPLGLGLPAIAQSGRAGAVPSPLETFRADGDLDIGGPDPIQTVDLTPSVPAGKLLVVESMYASLGVPTGTAVIVHAGPPDQEVPLPVVQTSSFGGQELQVVSGAGARLYVTTGPVRGRVGRLDPSVIGIARFTVVGHLVSAQAP